MRRCSRGGAAASDSDADWNSEASTSEDDEVVEVQEPVTSSKRARAVRINDDTASDEEKPAPKRRPDPNGGASGSRPVGTPALRPRRGKPGKLTLKRGIRSPSISSTDDDNEHELDVTVRSSGGQRATPRKQMTRQGSTLRSSERRRNTQWTTKVGADHHVDEDEWQWGTMRNRQDFYDRRQRHKFVGAERVSDDSAEGSEMDDFIAGDDEDDEDDEDSDENKDEDEPRRSRRRGHVMSASDPEPSAHGDTLEAIDLRSADSNGEEDAGGRGKGNKKPGCRLRRKSDVPPPPSSSEDDLPSMGRRGRRLRPKFRVVANDDQGSAPAPGPASSSGDLEDAGPKETPGKKSARLSSRAKRKSREWSQKQSELARGVQRTFEELDKVEHGDLNRLEDLFEDVDDLEGFVDEDGEDAAAFGSCGDNGTHKSARRGRGKSSIDKNGWVDDSSSDESDENENECIYRMRNSDSDDEDKSSSDDEAWVYYECGVCENNDTAMMRCENIKCRAWQHVACVDVDPETVNGLNLEGVHCRKPKAFFSASCSTSGGRRAPTPPGRQDEVRILGQRVCGLVSSVTTSTLWLRHLRNATKLSQSDALHVVRCSLAPQLLVR